jgi:hypothetical protein
MDGLLCYLFYFFDSARLLSVLLGTKEIEQGLWQ